MITRVLVVPKLIAAFRKKALRAFPNEVMETLWGRVEGDTAVITSLKAVEQTASDAEVIADMGDVLAPAMSGTGERYLGSIHSHPGCEDASPSMVDWLNSYNVGEILFAVMAVVQKQDGRFATTYSFFEPRPLIHVIHPKVRKTWKPKTTSSPSGQGSVDMPRPVLGRSVVGTVDT